MKKLLEYAKQVVDKAQKDLDLAIEELNDIACNYTAEEQAKQAASAIGMMHAVTGQDSTGVIGVKIDRTLLVDDPETMAKNALLHKIETAKDTEESSLAIVNLKLFNEVNACFCSNASISESITQNG